MKGGFASLNFVLVHPQKGHSFKTGSSDILFSFPAGLICLYHILPHGFPATGHAEMGLLCADIDCSAAFTYPFAVFLCFLILLYPPGAADAGLASSDLARQKNIVTEIPGAE